MTKTDIALKRFENSNCCQAVLTAFMDEIGLSESICLKLGAGFGAGMNCGETCGAVTGAYMTLGMAFGGSSNDSKAESLTRQNIRRFSERFTEEEGSLLCKELLGVNISFPEGREFAVENELFTARCPNFIRTSIRILEDQLAVKKERCLSSDA